MNWKPLVHYRHSKHQTLPFFAIIYWSWNHNNQCQNWFTLVVQTSINGHFVSSISTNYFRFLSVKKIYACFASQHNTNLWLWSFNLKSEKCWWQLWNFKKCEAKLNRLAYAFFFVCLNGCLPEGTKVGILSLRNLPHVWGWHWW